MARPAALICQTACAPRGPAVLCIQRHAGCWAAPQVTISHSGIWLAAAVAQGQQWRLNIYNLHGCSLLASFGHHHGRVSSAARHLTLAAHPCATLQSLQASWFFALAGYNAMQTCLPSSGVAHRQASKSTTTLNLLQFKRALQGHSHTHMCACTVQVYDLRWSPDDSFLVSASADCTARLWQTGLVLGSLPSAADASASVQKAHRVLQHSCFVYATAVHPKAEVVATGAFDHGICLWEVQTGQQATAAKASPVPHLKCSMFRSNEWQLGLSAPSEQ